MTDMNPIATTKIAQGSQPLGGATTGVTANSAGAGNFWDMIFSALAAGDAEKLGALVKADGAKAVDTTALPANTNANAAATVAAPKPADTNPLALLQIALSNQTLDADGNVVLPETSADDMTGLQSRLDLTNTVINQLKNLGADASKQDGVLNQLLAKLQTRSTTLQTSLSALETGTISKDTPVEDIPFPLLIALGLNPAEISEVTDNIKALEEKLGREITVEDLIAGVGNLIPQAPQTPIIANAGLKTNAGLPAIDDTTEPTDDLAAQLNALDVGGEAPEEEILNATLKRAEKGLDVRGEAEVSSDVINTDVKKSGATFKENLMNLIQGNKQPAPVTGSSGEILIPATMFSSDADTTLWQQMGIQPTSTLNLGPAAQAAGLSSSHAHAGQTHPATQLVAATMTKAGKDGTADTMTLQLDPPELGAVNIKLEFGKDKTVKAHLVVEKPETYMMLQRDGVALERALQSAGLDANNSSISFELASDGGNFDNNGKGGGEENTGGSARRAESADDETIQSTMTWQVDSNTGHVRYNILA